MRPGSRSVTPGILNLTPRPAIILFGAFAIQSANLAWPEMPPVTRISEGVARAAAS